MISINAKRNKKARPGVALLVVLFIVMAITILSLGFVSRSDVELACGQNMLLRTQMDYLAESGLEHARGLILNPQDVNDPIYPYWRGGSNLQLTSGNDYYDVTVNRDPIDPCNYIIDCNAYRLEGGEKIGRSSLKAELRLDPCIAYWAGSDTIVWTQMTVNGDVYCGGTLTNNGDINGDVFAVDTIGGTNPQGRKNELVASAPVPWPGLLTSDFGPINYYIGSTQYSAQQIVDPNIPTMSFEPNEANLAGILYCAADVNMPGDVTIIGALFVDGDLTVSGENSITAVKNFPALVVGGQVLMTDGSSLVINGLAQIGGPITVDPSDPNPTITPSIDVIGGLFIANGGVTSDKIIVNITAAPAIASIETWSSDGDGTSKRWSPAAGAFYRSIERQ